MGPGDVAVRILMVQTQPDSEQERTLIEAFFRNYSALQPQITMFPTGDVAAAFRTVQSDLALDDPQHDIYTCDLIWLGAIGETLLDLTGMLPEGLKENHAEAIWANENVNGRHIALPLQADYGVLYYRKDLLVAAGFSGDPPQTWDEMETMIRAVRSNARTGGSTIYGYLSDFKSEGLTCGVMEWLASADAGSVFADDTNRTVTLSNPRAAGMLRRMSSWFSNSWIPDSALSNDDPNYLIRTYWLAGKVLFFRSWPSLKSQTEQYIQQNNASWQIGITGLPGVTPDLKFPSTLGGWHIGANAKVAQNSTRMADVLKIMLLMSSNEFQQFRYMNFGALQTSESFTQSNSIFNFSSLRVVSRPTRQSNPFYNEVSNYISTGINGYLPPGQNQDPIAVLNAITEQIELKLGTHSTVVASRAQYISFDSPLGISLTAVAVLGILLTFATGLYAFVHLRREKIRGRSPLYLTIILFGITLGFASIFTYIGNPTQASCAIQPWPLTIAFATTFSAILAKVHTSWSTPAKHPPRLSNRHLLRFVTVGTITSALILFVYTITSRPQPIARFSSADSAYVVCASTESGNYTSILLSLGAAVVLITSVLAFRAKESNITLCMLNTLVCGGVTSGLVFIDSLGVAIIGSIRVCAIAAVCGGVLVLVCIPHVRSGADVEVGESLVLDGMREARGQGSADGVVGGGGVRAMDAGVELPPAYRDFNSSRNRATSSIGGAVPSVHGQSDSDGEEARPQPQRQDQKDVKHFTHTPYDSETRVLSTRLPTDGESRTVLPTHFLHERREFTPASPGQLSSADSLAADAHGEEFTDARESLEDEPAEEVETNDGGGGGASVSDGVPQHFVHQHVRYQG